MVNEQFSQEEVLGHLAYRPHYILRRVILVDESAKLSFSNIQRNCQSSIGRLDELPIELLHAIFEILDLESLSRVSRVSLRGKNIVESLPAYRDLLLSAGHIFRILSRTRVINRHSSATLHAALHADRCVSCGDYGAFLFLLTFERCCIACISGNQSLWMVPLSVAGDCFNLTKTELKTLPTMRSIPRKYSVKNSVSRQRPIRLTSVKAAKERALQVHGSIDAMARSLAEKRPHMTLTKFYKTRWLQDAPLQPLSQDPLTLEYVSNTPNDDFCGMGCVPFPSMTGSNIETGMWCRGCERTSQLYHDQKLNASEVSWLVPPGCETYRYMNGIQYRARSEAEFLEHAEHCYSAREVITRRWIWLT